MQFQITSKAEKLISVAAGSTIKAIDEKMPEETPDLSMISKVVVLLVPHEVENAHLAVHMHGDCGHSALHIGHFLPHDYF